MSQIWLFLEFFPLFLCTLVKFKLLRVLVVSTRFLSESCWCAFKPLSASVISISGSSGLYSGIITALENPKYMGTLTFQFCGKNLPISRYWPNQILHRFLCSSYLPWFPGFQSRV